MELMACWREGIQSFTFQNNPSDMIPFRLQRSIQGIKQSLKLMYSNIRKLLNTFTLYLNVINDKISCQWLLSNKSSKKPQTIDHINTMIMKQVIDPLHIWRLNNQKSFGRLRKVQYQQLKVCKPLPHRKQLPNTQVISIPILYSLAGDIQNGLMEKLWQHIMSWTLDFLTSHLPYSIKNNQAPQ